jgi:hypothetical protein
MPRKKKDPEIITDHYAHKLALEEQLAVTNAAIADNQKAAYAAFGEYVIDENPEWANEALAKKMSPELRDRLLSYGWKHIIEKKIAASKKNEGQQSRSEPPVSG